ncbi:aldolase/citrate lyase family protein [Rhodococcus rhodochrous]|uniref:Aldolase/citrate lyase family protein n=1 Tax=Rhodococcus rhodochrous TaxID=1829 RepID=A0AAW4XND9_RHORH|nr:aldolase/citrate lyase family protein [Rhodococcus rhodochrous]MCD2114583.1 aldolase/citrate lyase family protein [Rhodococcus rhodochrous]
MSTFLERLEVGPVPLGTWVKLPATESVELMALAGFDFVVIDLEHSPMSIETVSRLVATARGRGLSVLVRVPDHSPATIGRCLDLGADGVVVPHVDTVAQARQVGRAARFPPDGDRGVGPTSRAGAWGMSPLGEYLTNQSRIVVIAQIESRTGIENVAAIAAEPTIDALFLGPVDLSVALGLTGEELAAELTRVAAIARSAGIPVGTAIGGEPEQAAELAHEGYHLVMTSNDATILAAGSALLVRRYRAALDVLGLAQNAHHQRNKDDT